MSEPQLSIVIPAYGNWWLTRRCLQALDTLRTTSKTRFETIVVDNASQDETPIEIQRFPWVLYLQQEINTNFAGACNIGARAAAAPLVLFLNNDAMPIGDAPTMLARAFEDERVAIAGGCMLFEDGPVQSADVVVLPEGGWWLSYRNLPNDLPEVCRSREVAGVTGAAMMVDKAWFDEAGGLDEGYINGSEDIDLFMRAHESGRTLRYVANARFYHYESASPARYAHDEANAKRFFRRWHERMAELPRVERGEIGAIAIAQGTVAPRSAALNFALEDLIAGLRSFGHPIVRGTIKPWSLLDGRFRTAATLAWFCDDTRAKAHQPSVQVQANGALARLCTYGVEEVGVPWLPCASPETGERCSIVSGEGNRSVVAVIGDWESAPFTAPGVTSVEIGDLLDIRNRPAVVDLAVLRGLTDACAYGNLALAHAGVPVVVLDGPGVRNVYTDDTAFIATPENIHERIAYALAHLEVRREIAERMRADANRRFSPRRAAMRVTDLARVARHGFEKQGKRIKDSPIALD